MLSFRKKSNWKKIVVFIQIVRPSGVSVCGAADQDEEGKEDENACGGI